MEGSNSQNAGALFNLFEGGDMLQHAAGHVAEHAKAGNFRAASREWVKVAEGETLAAGEGFGVEHLTRRIQLLNLGLNIAAHMPTRTHRQTDMATGIVNTVFDESRAELNGTFQPEAIEAAYLKLQERALAIGMTLPISDTTEDVLFAMEAGDIEVVEAMLSIFEANEGPQKGIDIF